MASKYAAQDAKKLSVVHEGLQLRCRMLFVIIGPTANDIVQTACDAAASNMVQDGAEAMSCRSTQTYATQSRVGSQRSQASAPAGSQKTNTTTRDASSIRTSDQKESARNSENSHATLSSEVSPSQSQGRKKQVTVTDGPHIDLEDEVPVERSMIKIEEDVGEASVTGSVGFRSIPSLESFASFATTTSRCRSRTHISTRMSQMSVHMGDFDRELNLQGDEGGIYCMADEDANFVCRIRFHNVAGFQDNLPRIDGNAMLRNTCYIFLIDTRHAAADNDFALDKASQTLTELKFEYSSKKAGLKEKLARIRSRIVVHEPGAWGEAFELAGVKKDRQVAKRVPALLKFVESYTSTMEELQAALELICNKADFEDSMSLYAVLQEICQEMYELNNDTNPRSSCNIPQVDQDFEQAQSVRSIRSAQALKRSCCVAQ